jgi:hypothetical protein
MRSVDRPGLQNEPQTGFRNGFNGLASASRALKVPEGVGKAVIGIRSGAAIRPQIFRTLARASSINIKGALKGLHPVCCEHCKQPIPAGTGHLLLNNLRRAVWVCVACFSFAASAVFGQTSPPENPPPILLDVGAPSMYTNTAAQIVTNTSSGSLGNSSSGTVGFDSYRTVATLPVSPPIWASAELKKEHPKLSKEDLGLGPADKARLRRK